jgi:cellulose synthase/poly-beta-1,6-N-acetylglucosamine synthase-like glycosyltransferase/tetratricopeptide (TPR) repeat protein
LRDLGTNVSTRPDDILKEPDSQKIAGMLWSITVVGAIIAFVAIGYIFRANLFSIGIYSLSFYGVFTVTHFIAQMIFASMNQKSWIEKENYCAAGNYEPTVSVVIPTYKEDPALLRACLESIAGQNYTNIVQVILSNDGGDQSAGKIFQEVARGKKGWTYLFNEHRGKRGAMYSGFNAARGDVIVCIDSDTVIDSEAIRELIKPLACEDVGCSTGNLRVLNRGENILTRLSDLRYWLSFNLERAAQSYFGVVTCVSGPLGAYKRTVIEQVKDSYVRQTFFGNPCTYGDDRHLTNLVLSLGLKSAYVLQAIAETESPDRLRVWIKQQLRWSRSFFREFLVGLRWLRKHNIWLAFDLTYQATFPFFLGVNVVIILYLAVNGTGAPFVLWIGLLIFFGLVRALYGAVSTRDVRFLQFTGYGILYVTILLPLKVYALATLWNPTWGTRQFSQTVPEESSSSRYEVGVPGAVPSVLAAEAHEALREAIGELAPVGGMERDTLGQRHATADEVIYYWELGRYSEALASLSSRQSVVPAENLSRWRSWYGRIESTLGPEHPDTLSTRRNIAYWTGQTGDDREALRLSRELLPDQERVLGPEHPDTLNTRHNIAYWTGQTGDVREALRLSKELLPDQKRVLGPEHPDTLSTMSNIASWMGETGDPREALSLSRELLPDQEQVLGPDHPDTLTTRHNIAYWTGRAGDVGEALRLSKELLPDQERALGPDHPDTLTTRHNIASWTGRAGGSREALRLFKELLPDRERVLGPEHPGTLATRNNVASWTGETGDAREALRLFKELLPDRERVLGSEHPGTLTTRLNIAYWTGQTGDIREALRLSRELLPDQERVLGPDHPDTLRTRAWMDFLAERL